MTKRARSRMKEARWLYEDLIELNELYGDVKLMANKIEALLGRIDHMSTNKETEYLEYFRRFEEERFND